MNKKERKMKEWERKEEGRMRKKGRRKEEGMMRINK